MSRILWIGDAAQTGFGAVTWDIGSRMLAAGEDVRFISQNQTGEPIPEPLGPRTWAAEAIHPANAISNGFKDGWQPEACVVLGDFASVRYVVTQMSKEVMDVFGSIPTFHYCPIEGVDLPPSWAELWSVIRPVAMSRFGQEEISKVTGIRPPMIYHGVDTEMFHPVSLGTPGTQGIRSREQAKQFFGLPHDAVMCLRTDRHMPRKRHDALIRLFGPLLEEHEKLVLVLHCRPIDQGGNLADAISKLPEKVRSRVVPTGMHNTFSGLPRPVLNLLYNSADLYVSVSAEGFGLTIAEAIACGVPAVGLDYSAVPEVIGPAGVTVPYTHLLDNEYQHAWAAVDEDAYRQKVDFLVRHKSKREALGALGPGHIARNFSWDTAARQFSDLVTEALGRAEAAA